VVARHVGRVVFPVWYNPVVVARWLNDRAENRASAGQQFIYRGFKGSQESLLDCEIRVKILRVCRKHWEEVNKMLEGLFWAAVVDPLLSSGGTTGRWSLRRDAFSHF
jgi:hypothetical protein